jgi:hypothetical protein
MRALPPLAVVLCGVVGVPSACVVENSTPPYVPPPAAKVPPRLEAGAPLEAAVEAAAVTPLPVPTPSPAASEAGAAVAPASSPAAELLACSVDADCVVVPRNSCCNNGHKEAVNGSRVDAYKASFVCPEARPICPMFRVRDDRVPVCDAAAHRCELVSRR